MAIIKSMGIGKASGSIDNITYSTVQGRTIGRSKASFVANPNTAAQQAQRGKMRDIVFVWREAGLRLQKLWTKRAKYNSPYNAFVSKNIMNSTTYSAMPDLGVYSLEEGFILGEGQYSSENLELTANGQQSGVRILENSALFHTLKVGDVLGCVFLGDSGQIVDVVEHTLAAEDLDPEATFVAQAFNTFKDDITGHAVYWYSPSRKISTTCVCRFE